MLARAGGRAGDVRLDLTCLDDAVGRRRGAIATGSTAGGSRAADAAGASGGDRGQGSWSLAAIGANARRASEDSATVAYLGEPQAGAARFSETILEAAGIGQVTGPSGAAAMAAVLKAVREAGGAEDMRADVRKDLERG